MAGPSSGEIRSDVRHLEVEESQAGQRLDNFIQRVLGNLPRSRVYRVIRKGEVRVNGKRAEPETRLQAHDQVRIPPIRAVTARDPAIPTGDALETVRSAIVHEDERLIVLNKPAGMAVHGGSGISFGVIEALRALKPEETLELVHRLDRDTSGCLLIARNTPTLRILHALLRDGAAFEKRYLALLKGSWNLGKKRIEIPLRTDVRVNGERTVKADPAGKSSLSEFRPVQFFGKWATLMEVAIETGRTHQIRVHAQHAGHPVAGDEKYGDLAFNAQMRELGLHRMFLHASSVSFQWPHAGEFSVNTPLPPQLAALIDRLGDRAGRDRAGRDSADRTRSGRQSPRHTSPSGAASGLARQGPDRRRQTAIPRLPAGGVAAPRGGERSAGADAGATRAGRIGSGPSRRRPRPSGAGRPAPQPAKPGRRGPRPAHGGRKGSVPQGPRARPGGRATPKVARNRPGAGRRPAR